MSLLIPLLLLVVVMVPLTMFVPITIDSGVFRYGGQQLFDGGLAYSDFWDHKGPLLYVLNLAGQGIGDLRGVVLLESFLLGASIVGAGLFWIGVFPSWSISFFLCLFVVSYFRVFEGGNFSETWVAGPALVGYAALASALVAFYLNCLSERRLQLSLLAISFALAISVFTRLNNTPGLWIGLVCVLLLFPRLRVPNLRSPVWKSVMVFGLLPFLAVTLVSLIAVRTVESLSGLVDQYLLFNLFNTESDPTKRWDSSLALLDLLTELPLFISGLAICLGALIGIALKREKRQLQMLLILIVCTTIDLAASLISGRGFLHYLVTTLPSLTALAILSWFLFSAHIGFLARPHWFRALLLSGALLILLPSLLGTIKADARAVSELVRNGLYWDNSPLSRITKKIDQFSEPSGEVFLFSPGETFLLSAAKAKSTTRLTYLYHLADPRTDYPYASELRLEVARSVRRNRPQLIIRSSKECPFARDQSECGSTLEVDQFRSLGGWISKNYRPIWKTSLYEGLEFWIPRRNASIEGAR